MSDKETICIGFTTGTIERHCSNLNMGLTTVSEVMSYLKTTASLPDGEDGWLGKIAINICNDLSMGKEVTLETFTNLGGIVSTGYLRYTQETDKNAPATPSSLENLECLDAYTTLFIPGVTVNLLVGLLMRGDNINIMHPCIVDNMLLAAERHPFYKHVLGIIKENKTILTEEDAKYLLFPHVDHSKEPKIITVTKTIDRSYEKRLKNHMTSNPNYSTVIDIVSKASTITTPEDLSRIRSILYAYL